MNDDNTSRLSTNGITRGAFSPLTQTFHGLQIVYLMTGEPNELDKLTKFVYNNQATIAEWAVDLRNGHSTLQSILDVSFSKGKHKNPKFHSIKNNPSLALERCLDLLEVYELQILPALQKASPEKVKTLMTHASERNFTPLHSAVLNGKIELLEKIDELLSTYLSPDEYKYEWLRSGPNGINLLHESMPKYNPKISSFVLERVCAACDNHKLAAMLAAKIDFQQNGSMTQAEDPRANIFHIWGLWAAKASRQKCNPAVILKPYQELQSLLNNPELHGAFTNLLGPNAEKILADMPQVPFPGSAVSPQTLYDEIAAEGKVTSTLPLLSKNTGNEVGRT